MYKRILVATDLSEGADVALGAARILRERDGATVAVCHVMPDLRRVNILFPQVTEHAVLASMELEARAQEAVRTRASERLGDADVEVFIEHGAEYERIATRAAEWSADLVVVGSRGQTGLQRALLGSVAERVVRGAGRSVLVARGSLTSDGPVLAATDLSEPSFGALRAARAQADRSGRELVALFAAEIPSHPILSAVGLPFGITVDAMDAETMKQVESAAEEALRSAVSLAGVEAKTKVVVGPAAASVVAEADAQRASLVVVATHGRTGLSRLALGSVAETIVRHASSSVLVVPLEASA